MGGLFALERAARGVFDPGVVEGADIDFLRVNRQMGLQRRRKVVDRRVGMLLPLDLIRMRKTGVHRGLLIQNKLAPRNAC
jgi:hypothetical protein